MKTEVKLSFLQHPYYAAPSMEIINVFVEKGFADSDDENEDVGKDGEVNFY